MPQARVRGSGGDAGRREVSKRVAIVVLVVMAALLVGMVWLVIAFSTGLP